MNKSKKKNWFIMPIAILILLIVNSVMVLMYGGAIAAFHIKDENTNQEEIEKLPTKVEIKEKDNAEITLFLNETRQLSLVDDIGTTKLNAWNFNWISSDESVATISSSGLLVAKNVGTTIVRVTNKNDVNLFDIVKVIVLNKVSGLDIVRDEKTIEPMILNEVKKINLTLGGKIAQNKVIWKSSDESILTVIDGFVYANDIGKAVITATSSYDAAFHDSIELEVKDDSIRITPSSNVTINHVYLNMKEIAVEDLFLTPLAINDEIVLNANSDCNQYSQTVFSSTNGLLELISQDDHTASFKVIGIGRDFINISSKYNSTTSKFLEVRVYDQFKAINKFDLTKPSNIINNSCSTNLNEIMKLEITSENGIIDYNDLVVDIEDDNVIQYMNGYLSPQKIGETKLVVSYLYDSTKKIEFNVKVISENNSLIPVKHVSIDYFKLNNAPLMSYFGENIVSVNDKITFSLNVYPFDSTYLDAIEVFTDHKAVVDVAVSKIDLTYLVTLNFKENGKAKVYVRPFGNLKEEKILNFNVGNVMESFDFNISFPKKITAAKPYKVNLNTSTTGIDQEKIKYYYSSSNPNVLTVGPNGDVMSYDKGEVTISVSAVYEEKIISKTHNVTIEKEYKTYDRVQKMTCSTFIRENDNYIPIDFTTQFLNVYQKAYLNVVVSPNYNNANNFIVTSDNEHVISIYYQDNMYHLQSLAPGTATIKIRNYENDELSQEIKIVVYDVLPKYFIPKLESTVLTIGENEIIEFISDSSATYTRPKFSFSTEGVVEIENNALISKHIGSTTLIIEITNEKDKYVLTIPIQVVRKANISLFDYSTAEIVAFIAFYAVSALIFVYYLLNFVFNLNLNRKIKIMICGVAIAIFLVLPQLVTISSWSNKIKLTTFVVEIIGGIIGVMITLILKKRGIANEQE